MFKFPILNFMIVHLYHSHVFKLSDCQNSKIAKILDFRILKPRFPKIMMRGIQKKTVIFLDAPIYKILVLKCVHILLIIVEVIWYI